MTGDNQRSRRPTAAAAALAPQGKDGGDKRTPTGSGDPYEKAEADWQARRPILDQSQRRGLEKWRVDFTLRRHWIKVRLTVYFRAREGLRLDLSGGDF